MKTEVKRNKKEKRGSCGVTLKVTFDGLTKGELMAMKHALEEYAEKSPVGSDVYMYLKNALYEAAKTDSLLNDI